MGTSNGTEDNGIRYRTADGYVFKTYNEAYLHSIQESYKTNAGTYIEEI